MGSSVSEMALFEIVVDMQTAMSCFSSPQPNAHPVLVKQLHTLPHSLATYLSRLPALCCRPAWDRSVTDRLQSTQLRHILWQAMQSFHALFVQ
jgi:hypothetical protein